MGVPEGAGSGVTLTGSHLRRCKSGADWSLVHEVAATVEADTKGERGKGEPNSTLLVQPPTVRS